MKEANNQKSLQAIGKWDAAKRILQEQHGKTGDFLMRLQTRRQALGFELVLHTNKSGKASCFGTQRPNVRLVMKWRWPRCRS